MKLSETQKDEIRDKVARYLIRYPGTSYQKIAKALGISHQLVSKLHKEIRERNLKEMKGTAVEEELADFQAEAEELVREIWQVIRDEKTNLKTKRLYIRELLNLRTVLFDKKFDAGVFTKKLGEMDIHTQADLMRLLKENVGQIPGQDNAEGSA